MTALLKERDEINVTARMLQEIMCVSSLKEVYTAELEGRGVDESNSGALRVVRTKLGWKLPEPHVGRRTGSVCVSRKERQVSHTSRTTHCPIQFIKNRCLFFFGYKSARACHSQHTRCSRRCCSPTCTVFSRIAESRPAAGVCRQCRLCRENTNTWNLEQTKAIFILAVPSTVVRRVGGVRQTVASRTEASARTFFFGESTGCEFAGAAVAMVDCNFLCVYANSYECF